MGLDDIKIIYYEVFVLGRDGWDMHARYPREDRRIALTEAKTLEAQLAAATKVVRSEYHPRSNTEERSEVYASKLTPNEFGQPMTMPSPVATASANRPVKVRRKRRHVVHRRDMTPAAVLLRLAGILASSAVLATLITAYGGIFFERVELFEHPTGQAGKGLVYGVFMTIFLLVALPWILSFARQIEVVGFAAPGPGSHPKARPGRRRPDDAPKPADGGLLDPMATADLPPLPVAGALEPDDDAAGFDAPLPPAAPQAAAAGPAADPVAQPEPAAPSADPRDVGTAAAERLLKQRRSLLRFLRSLVIDLRETRPNLNSFERYGLGLLLSGAVDQVVEDGDLGPRGRAQLLREALGILGRQPGLIEAVEDGLGATLSDPRSGRMMLAGRNAMQHFLGGSRDFLAAVLSAMEVWNRPTGATGGGIVAAMLVQVWPDEEAALDLAYAVAQLRGGAVIGSVDGIALLFPGIARATQAALEMMPQLPAAARIGIAAAEAATEDEAVRAVGGARLLCHAAHPGQILCSAAVRSLGARGPGSFEPAEQIVDGLPAYNLRPAAADPPEPAGAAPPAGPPPGTADPSPAGSAPGDPAG